MLLHETAAAWQTQVNHEKKPLTASAAVYVWEWSLEMLPKFTHTLVPKQDHEEMLADACPGEVWYDAFCNKWNICTDWLNESYKESDKEADEGHADKLCQGRDEGSVNSLAGAYQFRPLVQCPPYHPPLQ
jgi:hypothetical protein